MPLDNIIIGAGKKKAESLLNRGGSGGSSGGGGGGWYSMEQARAQGQQDFETQRGNLSAFLEDAFNKSMSYYKNRGFGGGLEAPGTLESIRSPYIAQEGKRLTDLWFTTQNMAQQNALRWNADRRARILTNQQYDLAEEQLAAYRRKAAGMKVLCTALFRQGLLPKKYMKADLIYLKNYVTKLEHEQYLAWATPIAEAMMRNKLLCYLLWLPIYLWNQYMYQTVNNKKLNLLGLLGKVINNIGLWYGKIYHRKAVA